MLLRAGVRCSQADSAACPFTPWLLPTDLEARQILKPAGDTSRIWTCCHFFLLHLGFTAAAWLQILKPAEKKQKYLYAMNPRPATPPRA